MKIIASMVVGTPLAFAECKHFVHYPYGHKLNSVSFGGFTFMATRAKLKGSFTLEYTTLSGGEDIGIVGREEGKGKDCL